MKKIYLLLLLIVFSLVSFAQEKKWTRIQLDSMFANQWNKPEYLKANTAEDEYYLSQDEKDVYRYLNMARMNPPLFAETYLAQFNGVENYVKGYAFNERKKSLMDELKQMQPLALLTPEKTVYESAKCFAQENGASGAIGNDRKEGGCENKFAECCAYNSRDGLFAVLGFLINSGEGNANLGHRKLCLGDYGVLGVSIKPHTKMKFVTVLNFGYKPNVVYKRNGYEGCLTPSGEFEGRGVYTFPNGDKYDGNWYNNEPDGYGTYTYTNGNSYEGQWKNGKRKGLGTLTYSSGNKYIGEWEDSQMHGQGTFYFATGDKIEGVWNKGEQPQKTDK